MLKLNKTSGAWLVILGLFVAHLFLYPISSVSALSGSEWNPGNIIDDGIFYDKNGMTTSDIQNFLNQRNPNCDTYGTQPSEYGGGTRAQYGASRGYPAPYICMKDYYENTSTRENNLRGTVPSGAISAAQIIKQASDAYSINPKVLIVLLQKEQTLVTDVWPFPPQYRSATGYGCPDTAACDSQYYGFYNQVNNAARQFRLYANNPSSYRYKPYQSNYIQYNPNAGCGGTNVQIRNAATAGLYNYTPYQPNQSALNNLYGSGDSCGAYGNRNFWRLFNEWFGDVYVPYIATYVSQTPAVSLAPGQTGAVSFRFKNSGNSPWQDGANATADSPKVHLATSAPVNRSSMFSAGWPNAARPNLTFTKVYEANGTTLAANQHIVSPGQIAEYTVPLTAPADARPGIYEEVFTPVRDGAQNWSMRVEASTNVTIINPYRAEFISQTHAYMSGLQNNYIGDTSMRFKNIGALTWKDDASRQVNEPGVHLATFQPVNRPSGFSAGWPNAARPNLTFTKVYEANGTTLAANQHIVSPGQIAEYTFPVTIPDSLSWGTYREYFAPVADGYKDWNMTSPRYIDVQVHQSVHQAAYYSQSAYPLLSLNETGTSFLSFKNTGNSSWYDAVSTQPGVLGVRLATDIKTNRASAYAHNWPTRERPNLTFTKVYEANGTTLAANQHIVSPGQIAKFEFDFKNHNLRPSEISREGFTPVLDGSTRWSLTNQKVWLDLTGK